MAATITLSNIQSYAQITTNVESRMIDFHIEAVRKLELDEKLGTALMAVIDNAFDNSGTLPETEAFFNNYVVPYWSLSTYLRFLATHGVNVTQFGVTIPNDPRGTFNQASEDQRANMLRQAESDKRIYDRKMTDYLESVGFVLDGVTFTEEDSLERSNKYVNPIRKKQRRPFGNRYNFNRFDEIL